MYMRFSNLRESALSPASAMTPSKGTTYLRLMAGSSCHGIFVAPRTNTPVSSLPTPLIWLQLALRGRTHLHQELRLDPPTRFRLALPSRARQTVNLVDEDDCGLLFPRHGEQLLHQSSISQASAY